VIAQAHAQLQKFLEMRKIVPAGHPDLTAGSSGGFMVDWKIMEPSPCRFTGRGPSQGRRSCHARWASMGLDWMSSRQIIFAGLVKPLLETVRRD